MMVEEISLKEAIRLSKKKLDYLIEYPEGVADHLISTDEELYSLVNKCAFCQRNLTDDGFIDCCKCKIRDICELYELCKYKSALEELEKFEETELGDDKDE